MSDADDPKRPDPPSEEDLDTRLARVRERAIKARQKQESQRPSELLDQDTSRGMGLGLSAAYAIIGLPLVGAGVGWLIDRGLGTTFVIAIGAVGGLIGGVWHAIQLTNRV